MKIKTALLFSVRSFWQSGKTKTASHNLRGAVTGIALSLLPLIVVIVVANGMIEGITHRLIEVFTYHLQVQLTGSPGDTDAAIRQITELDTVKHAHLEKSGFGLVRSYGGSSGATVKALDPRVLMTDEGFRENLNLAAGSLSLDAVPPVINVDVFEDKILPAADSNGTGALLAGSYDREEGKGPYRLIPGLDSGTLAELAEAFAGMKYTVALLGEALADKLEAGVGDQIFLLSVKELNNRQIPRSTRLLITGIFTTGYQDVDKYLLYIPYAAGAGILAKENSREYIGIKVTDPYSDLSPTITLVKSILRKYNISYSFVETWYQKQWTQYQSFKSTKASLIFIICLIILVAAVNVSSSIHMLVMSKTREIAILKSMGAKPATITLSFVLTGFFTGLTGTMAGIIVGLLLAVNINEFMKFVELLINQAVGIFSRIFEYVLFTGNKLSGGIMPVKILNPDYYLEKIPIIISLQEVVFVTCFSIFISTLASFFPAWKAGKVKPLEIIRRY